MCGLIGVISGGHLNVKERNAFNDLGFVSSLRGVDSSGVLALTKKKPRSPKVEYEYYKQAVNPVIFYLQRETQARVHKHNVVCLMGHSRAATQGSVNVHNAHPFDIQGQIIGMHNGTVHKYRPDRAKEDRETDSLLLYREIAHKGLYQTIANLYGADAYALTFYDARDGTVNIIRNKERPLIFAETDEGTLFWASEGRMLDLALSRNGIKITNLVLLEEDMHWKYSLIDNSNSCDKVDLDKYKERSISHVPGLPRVVFPKAEDRLNDPIPFTSPKESTGMKSIDSTDFSAAHDYIKEYLDANVFKPGHVENNEPRPTYLNGGKYRMRKDGKETWVSPIVGRSHLRHGCFNCKKTKSLEDTVHWTGPSLYVCDDCISLPIVQNSFSKIPTVTSKLELTEV